MTICFENLGVTVVKLPPTTGWRLWAEINDHEESAIMLEIDGIVYEVCNCWEYLQGEEKLCPYECLEFYSAVLMRVFEILEEGAEYINLEVIKNAILPSFWKKWIDSGKVVHSHWKCTE